RARRPDARAARGALRRGAWFGEEASAALDSRAVMEREEPPFVTVAVASKEDESRIEACLRCALAQDYPRERIEIIVADAMSMDATRERVMRIAEEDARVRLVDNADRTRAAALNVIVRLGRGEIVVPMDPGGDYGRT